MTKNHHRAINARRRSIVVMMDDGDGGPKEVAHLCYAIATETPQ